MKKRKKLKKTWRRVRKSVTHRIAACQDGTITPLTTFRTDWYAGVKAPVSHISELDIYNPSLTMGIYASGPIFKGFHHGEIFIDLGTERVWKVEKKKLGIEINRFAIHPGVLDPIMRNAIRRLEEYI
jgi:hypothetical protein